MPERDFINLTPYTTEILDENREPITTVSPSGAVALAVGDPPQLMNVPEPEDHKVFVVLPAIAEASDRPDLVSIELDEAQRSQRGNVQTHVCYWSDNDS